MNHPQNPTHGPMKASPSHFSRFFSRKTRPKILMPMMVILLILVTLLGQATAEIVDFSYERNCLQRAELTCTRCKTTKMFSTCSRIQKKNAVLLFWNMVDDTFPLIPCDGKCIPEGPKKKAVKGKPTQKAYDTSAISCFLSKQKWNCIYCNKMKPWDEASENEARRKHLMEYHQQISI